ncbi:peamaclein-like [Salvia miltiorrhiza]|uniref:peamaclein-like n=1 Tax=Salvia miltiorrhiza TaxID=226208 RepID=UPI0025ACE0E6|nr:peamaclein-like [Salvia miltiorrhiza]
MKVTIGAALVLSLLVCTTLADNPSSSGELSPFCKDKCDVRCSKAGREDRCLEYCGICCDKCKCVPSGTFGNRDECPCYRDLKNSKGQPKCP